MKTRRRSKLRRRDRVLQRYFQHTNGHGSTRVILARRASRVSSAQVVEPPQHMEERSQPPLVQSNPILRLDGDSIAYFWALETETAISYDTLVIHWRSFSAALRGAPYWW